jgi:catechol 2,3-dioxygenase
MGTGTIIHPKLQHIGLTTSRLQPMLYWYKTVLGMRLIYLSEDPTGAADSLGLKAALLSNDEANHRVTIIEIPGLTDDPERVRHHHLQHIAFEFRIIDELLGTYVRLKESGIVPVLPVDEGSQTAFY